METVAVLSTPPIPTGAATAVGQVTQTMDMLHGKMEGYDSRLTAAITQLLANADGEDVQFTEPPLNFQPISPGMTPTGALPSADMPEAISMDLPAMPSLVPSLPIKPAVGSLIPPTPISINIPPVPVSSIGAAPTRPNVDTNLTLPAAPTIDLPGDPDLLDISIPALDRLLLPTFTEAAPTFAAALPDAVMYFEEPQYASESFDEILSTLSRMRLGGTGLPAAIEQAIFDRGRAREDRTAEKSVQEVFDAHAGRGLPAPSGQLHAQVQSVREANHLAVSALSRDVLINATQVEIEQLRFAVIQGLAAEQILVNIFNNAAQRAFEQARFTVEMAVRLHDSLVTVFNALMSAWQTKASVHQAQLNSELSVMRLELDAEKIKSEVNQQRVQMMESRIRAQLAKVEVYKGELAGVQTQADIIKAIFDGYRIDVQAFSETIGAEKLKFDGHKALIEGEQVKAEIGRSNASIFASLVQADETKGRMWVQEAQVELSRIEQIGRNYGLSLDALRTMNAAQLGRISAAVDLHRVAQGATEVRNRAVIANAEANVRIGQQRLDAETARVGTAIKLYEVNITKLNQTRQIQQQAFQAVGQFMATLAGGAMAAQHVSASISSSASDGYSVSQSTNISNSLNKKI